MIFRSEHAEDISYVVNQISESVYELINKLINYANMQISMMC